LNEFRGLQQNTLLSRTGNYFEGTGNLYAANREFESAIVRFREVWRILIRFGEIDAERPGEPSEIRVKSWHVIVTIASKFPPEKDSPCRLILAPQQ